MSDREKLLNSKENFEDKRIEYYENLITPEELHMKLPNNYKKFIKKSREEISNIIHKRDNRLLLIIGPCSIHNIDEAKKYAIQLKSLSDKVDKKIKIVMRTYFEKPRTTVGWKGLINDPYLNESYNVNNGLFFARELLIFLAHINIPVACEILDPISLQYLSDLISWGAIGARTSESQIHRQISSGVSFPVGFKNGTSGNVDVAAQAVISAQYSHCFMGITKNGNPTICKTRGNNDTHIILRGGKTATNYNKDSVTHAESILEKNNVDKRIMIDCSHMNSNKNYKNQKKVVDYYIRELISNKSIIGLMIESNLNEGKQSLPENSKQYCKEEIQKKLSYGVSITDCCIGIQETFNIVDKLFNAL